MKVSTPFYRQDNGVSHTSRCNQHHTERIRAGNRFLWHSIDEANWLPSAECTNVKDAILPPLLHRGCSPMPHCFALCAFCLSWASRCPMNFAAPSHDPIHGCKGAEAGWLLVMVAQPKLWLQPFSSAHALHLASLCRWLKALCFCQQATTLEVLAFLFWLSYQDGKDLSEIRPPAMK